ncbi:Protein ELYS [Chamberlinius hualienensis]
MEVELIPHIEKVISFSSNITKQLKREKQFSDANRIFGKFYNGDRLAWLIVGSTLVVVHASNGNIYLVHNFGRNSSPDLVVTNAVELIDESQKWKLLVVTSSESSKGSYVHVFNVRQSKVDRVVYIPHKVTSLEVVSCAGGVNRSNVLLGQALRYFHGIVAVGVEAGAVLLLDLALDDELNSEFGRNSVDPLHLATQINYFTGRLNDLPQKREELAAENKVIAFPLTGRSPKGIFHYVSPDSDEMLEFSSVDVYVSSLLFVPQMGCLFVGFNFGGFQIYDLSKLQLVFTCETEEFDESPVIQFAFQEPENDPRTFCYVWIVRGQTEKFSEQFCQATLHSILFYNKTSIDTLGTCYLGVKQCVKRFKFPLYGYPISNEMDNWSSSRLIACRTIDSRTVKKDTANHDGNTGGLHSDSSGIICCCAFVWETYPVDKHSNSKMTLAIFDLNQWYQAQMPSSLKLVSSELCPYFGFFSLDTLHDLVSTNSLMDVFLVGQSLTRLAMTKPAESLFYPSALAFDLFGLTETGIVQASFLGLQRQVLRQIRLNSSTLLIEPTQILDLCVYCSLVTQPVCSGTIISQMTLSSKREAIFSMALESDAIEIIMSCITGWASGRYASEGCTLRFIQDWAWKKVLKIKSFLDKECTILYDCSGLQIDGVIGQSLRHTVVMLKHLEVIFKSLAKQTQAIPTTNQGAKELEHRVSVINLLTLHYDSVLWFINARLLPEASEGDEGDTAGFPYPKSALTRIFTIRRSEIQRISSSLKSTDLLLIDGLIDEEGNESLLNLWKNSASNSCYPPNSINALLNIYLLPDVSVSLKHTLVQYFLFDMSELLQNGPFAQLVEPLSDYASSFACNQNLIFLTKGFWLLDHKDFEGSINVLLHPMVNSMYILPWQSRRIIKAFLFQGEPEKALRFVQVHQPCKETAEDLQFYLTILLANGMVSDAFSYLRSVRDQANAEELINHFFLGCQQTNNLRGMLQLPYNTTEESSLVKFMSSNSDPKVRELLVIYHLQRSHFIEALQLNDQLNADSMHVTDPSAKERAATRNAIIEGYSRVYPNIQLELAKLTRSAIHQRKTFWEKGKKLPAPLSTIVMTNPVDPVSKSSVLEAVMQKITEVWTRSSPVSCDDDSSHTKLSLTITPFTPRRNIFKDHQHPVIHPTVRRRASLDPQPGTSDSYLATSPTKYRFIDASVYHPTESSKRRANSKIYSSELLSILQPVPVKRKIPIQKLLASSNTVASSPASILKQRTVIKNGSESDMRSVTDRDLPSDAVVTPTSSPIINRDDMKLSKIRFSSYNPDNQSSSPILKASTPINDRPSELSSSITPRRPLHSSDQSFSSHTSNQDEQIDDKTTTDESDGEDMVVDDDSISNSVKTSPQKNTDSTREGDESIYMTPEKSGFSPDTCGSSTSGSVPHRQPSKSYFSATGFRERMLLIKSELAKEAAHISDEITITSTISSNRTEIKIIDKPAVVSIIDETVDSCFASKDDELLEKYKLRRKAKLEMQMKTDEQTAISNKTETVNDEPIQSSESVTEDITNVQLSSNPSLENVTPTSELSINVEFPGITKASLRSHSPKSSPSSMSQSSKSERESIASVERNLDSAMDIVPLNLETVIEESGDQPAINSPRASPVPKESSKSKTSALRKTKKRAAKHNLQTFVFSPPTVVDAEVEESVSPISLGLSPSSAQFLFSTPLTRSKVKVRKSLLASSSKTSGGSVVKPVFSSATPKKIVRLRRSTETSTSDAVINFSSPALETITEKTTTKVPKARHNMTLRRSQTKTRTVTKFK